MWRCDHIGTQMAVAYILGKLSELELFHSLLDRVANNLQNNQNGDGGRN